jgi:hypothetical protein
MKCPTCGKEVIYVDYPPGMIYHVEDTEWGIHPNESGDPLDPGVIVAKRGTKAINDIPDVEQIVEENRNE